MVTLNYSYRIYPDSEQQQRLDEWLETSRQVYNYALRELKDWLVVECRIKNAECTSGKSLFFSTYTNSKLPFHLRPLPLASRKSPLNACSLIKEYIMPADSPFPSYHRQQNLLPAAKKDNPLLKDIPSQTLQCVIRRLHDSWDWFRDRGYGFPRFKKFGQFKSLLFPQFKSNPLTSWQIKLPKLGLVPINLHRPIPFGFVVKQVRVIKKAKGWFATIAIYADFEIPLPVPHGNAMGIDIGLEKFLATSDGKVENPPRFFRDLQSKLKLLQRRLSRKKQRSANYEKARVKVARLHNLIADTRKDYHYKTAHKLCDMAGMIFMEDLDFRIPLLPPLKGGLRGMGKQMLDGGFGQFRDILKWVCKRRGVFFDVVDSRGTSQECPNCQCEVKKDLSVRWHTCPECGYECDRDVASAQVIRDRGIQSVPKGIGERKPPAESVLAGDFG